jgi:hypothetical protein
MHLCDLDALIRYADTEVFAVVFWSRAGVAEADGTAHSLLREKTRTGTGRRRLKPV